MSEEESVLDNVQEHLNEDEGQSPQSKQSMSMYGPAQGIPRPGMPQSFRPGMRPPGLPPMGYRSPMMRGPRPLNMRPNYPAMRSMGMPGYRGPPRPFDGPSRPPYDMPLRGPPRYPPQRFSVRMNDVDLNNENAEGYYEQDSFSEDFQNVPPGMHLRGPPPRGYGMPPGPYMGAPPGPRSIVNGGPSGSEIGPPGYGPPRPSFMPPRNVPPGAPYPPLSPNGQGMPYDCQSGLPPVSGPSQPYGMPPIQNVSSNGDLTQQGHDVDSSSPNGLNQSGGPLLPTGQSDSDERQNMLSGQVPPNPMQPPYGMPPYGPPQGAYQQGMPPMTGGPPGPYMQMPMSFPSVPPMMHGGPMGMYSMPPPTQHSGPPSGYSSAPPMPGQPHPMSAPPPSNPREEIWIENAAPDGKAYFYNMQTRETRWDRPENVTIIKQGDVEKPSGTPSFHAPAVSQPPSIPIQANPVPVKPPEVAAWSEYKSGDGKSYYHNSQTNQTTWDKPQIIIDWENTFKKMEDQPKPLDTSSSTGISQTPPSTQNKVSENVITQVQVPDKKSDSLPQHTVVVDKQPEPEKEKESEQKDSSRPISSTAVSGTPWCVVWTGDGRVFFFNPSKRISVWETPDELKGRADVERLLEKPPGEGKDSSEDKKSDTLDQDPPAKKLRLVEPIQKQAEIGEATPKPEQMVVDDEVRQIVTERIGEDAMKEALDRAAKDQAVLPAEVRLQQFRQMLIDKQVSAFSTWDKELHKIVFDHRYLLLTCEERKQAFEAYVRERAEVERSEKKHKMREKKDKFNELLATANVNTKTSYSDFASKYGRDERFKGIEKSRERESLFQAFVSDLRRREKDKSSSKDKLKADFLALLKEHKSISRRSHWSDVKRKIDTDSRYKAVDSSSRREDWFREYIKKLDDVKEGGREDSEKRKEREKRERQEASLRERKKEVEEARTNSMRERDRERESHLRREAESNFNTLLTDVIKSEIMPWKEAKRLLRKNSRWDAIADVLTRSERENLFDAYVSGLNRKAKEVFLKMLEGNDSITYWTSWRDVKDAFKDDSRFEKLLSSEKKWKSEFRDWANERESKAKNSFSEMLKEKTSLLSSAKRQSSENSSMLDDVLSTLKADIRYRAVESSEAKTTLEDFLQSLSD